MAMSYLLINMNLHHNHCLLLINNSIKYMHKDIHTALFQLYQAAFHKLTSQLQMIWNLLCCKLARNHGHLCCIAMEI